MLLRHLFTARCTIVYAVICRFSQAGNLYERRAVLAGAYPGVASKARGRLENINVIMGSLL
jgi:hypothetical protein